MRDFVFGILGGTALLMYGVDLLGEGLERSAGSKMKSILRALTGNVYRAILVSTVLTALVQSSTTTTVLTVGFVNAGLMSLTQAIGVIYGANIGTTVTAQLMAFNLGDYALLFVTFGFGVRALAAKERMKHLGSALMGFGIMFMGLQLLNSGAPFLQANETFRKVFLICGQTPLLAVFIGMLATMLVHSSAAAVALTMVFARAGLINLSGAICLTLGGNIGTCITAQMASFNTGTSARRTAWAHTFFNVIGVIAALVALPVFVRITQNTSTEISRQIANSHTFFNLFNTLLFLPLTTRFVKFLEKVVPGEHRRYKSHLDELLLDTPPAAFQAVQAELATLTHTLKIMLDQCIGLIGQYDEKELIKFDENETHLNNAHKDITRYLMAVSRRALSKDESKLSSELIQASNLVERMGDHFEEISNLAKRKHEEGADFTMLALSELSELQKLLHVMLDDLAGAFMGETLDFEKQINESRATAHTMRQKHIVRLQGDQCSVDAGVIYFDIISHCEAVIDDTESIVTWLSLFEENED